MSDYDRALHELDMLQKRRLDGVRALLMDEGRPDLVADLDNNLKRVRSGIEGARNVWHSISPAQRRVLTLMAEGRKLVMPPHSTTRYVAIGSGFGGAGAMGYVCGLPTARALCERGLCHVDGGATDPERVIVLTERGAFVGKHGPLPAPPSKEA